MQKHKSLIYQPSFFLRLFFMWPWIFYTFLLSYAFIYGLFKVKQGSICVSPFLFISIIVCIWNINFLPSIGVSPNGLQIYSIYGTFRFLPWINIIKIRRAVFPPPLWKMPKLDVIVCKKVGWINRLYGVMFGFGGQVVLIDIKMKGYQEFLKYVRFYCPNAFIDQISEQKLIDD